jgi:tRNA(Ile)-lysidine synthase
MTALPTLDRNAWTGNGRLRVAFSGGADSLCLLKRLVDEGLRERVDALHVDHRLDAESRSRAEGAAGLAAELDVRFDCIVLDPAGFERHRGPEAAARHARYAALSDRLAPDDTLLTAHHLDDQIETVLLQLLRGGGPRGLSGMPVRRRLGPGWLGRPLLAWPRAALQQELRQAGLAWIEDPTNASVDPDRNYLRHDVLPLLEQRWGPGYRTAIDRARNAQAHAAGIIAERARQDLARLRQGSPDFAPATLDLGGWLMLSSSSAFEVLRHWLDPSPAPPSARCEEFRRQCREAARDRVPNLSSDARVIHAWRGRLWASSRPDPVPSSWSRPIDGRESSVELPHGLGRFEARDWPSTRICVGSIQAGDRLRTRAGRPRQRASELLREAGVPPWLRHQLPGLRVDERLVAIGDRWIDPELAAYALRWRDVPDELLPYAADPQRTNE